MREQQRATSLGENTARRPGAVAAVRVIDGLEYAKLCVRNRNSAEIFDPGRGGRNRHKRRPRSDHRMAQLGRPAIAVARGAAARIGLSARGNEQLASMDHAP